jgi:glycosyltransferase involved in cell wall biosynthesis
MNGAYRKELEQLTVGMYVRFEGFRSNPERYFAEADMFIMPSIGPEGLPMVSIEAMAYGLHCLFSDLEVHHEITADGIAGMLFRSGNAEDLRRKLLILIQEASLSSAYSRAAYRRVVDVYNPDLATRSYLCAFGLLAGGVMGDPLYERYTARKLQLPRRKAILKPDYATPSESP